jgi:2-C-methyl-D-erythritol 4-phosphate cytidylyltransferase
MSDKKMCSAVVVAAGSGTRFGEDIPKQFFEINGKPVLYYSLKALCDSDIIDEVIIVTSEEWIEFCEDEIVKKYGFDKVDGVVLGGKTRCDSVRAGVMVCDIASDYVFIHDGARPLLTEDMIRRGYETVLKYGTAVAAIPSTDTIKIADKDGVVLSTPDRSTLWRIQTPQIFRYDLILKAYFDLTDEDRQTVTDDAMLIERKSDVPVHLFEGSENNIKITTHNDIDIVMRNL